MGDNDFDAAFQSDSAATTNSTEQIIPDDLKYVIYGTIYSAVLKNLGAIPSDFPPIEMLSFDAKTLPGYIYITVPLSAIDIYCGAACIYRYDIENNNLELDYYQGKVQTPRRFI